MFSRIKKYFILILIAIICLPLFSYAQVGNKEEEVLFVAKKAFEDGYYEVSLGLLNRFLTDFPDSPRASEAELLAGQSYFYQGKELEALAKFEELLNKESALSIKDAVLYWIGEAYFKANNFPKAAATYRKVIDEFPRSSYVPVSHYSLGWSLFQEGSFKEALVYFKIMQEKYPKEPQTLDAAFKISECLYSLKDYPALRIQARGLLGLFAKDLSRLAYLYFYIAESEYYLDNFNQSLDFYKKVLKESADAKLRVLSNLGVGWSYLKLKDYKKAEAEFMLIKEEGLDKKILEALLLGRAESLLKQGRLKESRIEFKKVINVSDDSTIKEGLFVKIADIDQELGEHAAAIEGYKLVLAGYPAGSYRDYISSRVGVSVYALGLEYFQKQDYELCLKILEEARKNTKEITFLPDAAYLLGNCYYNLGDFKKAIELFKDARARSQDQELTQNAEYAIADSLYYLGREKEAVSVFNALRSRYPGSKLTARVLFWLAGYYYQQNEFGLSSRYFLSLIQDFPNSGLAEDARHSMELISFARGQELEVKGEPDAAVEEYLKIINDSLLKEKAFLRIARIYEDNDDFNQALKFYKQILAMGGENSSYAKERVDWIEFNL